jgi:hypothetical protein
MKNVDISSAKGTTSAVLGVLVMVVAVLVLLVLLVLMVSVVVVVLVVSVLLVLLVLVVSEAVCYPHRFVAQSTAQIQRPHFLQRINQRINQRARL